MDGKALVKTAFQDTIVYDTLQTWRRQTHLRRWQRRGRQVPAPHVVKELAVKSTAAKTGITTLVETGTFDGDMVYAVKDRFSRIFTIELYEPLYRRAVRRFAPYPHICCLHGDSAAMLPAVMSIVEAPCLFWLDGHFSGTLEGQPTGCGAKETPILEELDCISRHFIREHAILVDDARCFTGEGDYPTLASLRKWVGARFPAHSFAVIDDIIRILPT